MNSSPPLRAYVNQRGFNCKIVAKAQFSRMSPVPLAVQWRHHEGEISLRCVASSQLPQRCQTDA